MRIVHYIFAIGLGLPSAAFSQSDEKLGFVSGIHTPGFIKYAEIKVHDGVTDNCWTNSNSIGSRTRLLLEQNDIETIDGIAFHDMSAPVVYVSAFGFKNGSLCVVSAEFSVYSQGNSYWDASQRGGKEWFVAQFNEIHSSQYLFTGPGAVNDEISDWFDGQASEFIANVLSARRNPDVQSFMADFPKLFGRPATISNTEND